MAYTYTWTDAEQTSLRREDEAGNVAFVPVAEGNRDYAAFLASEAVPAAYVEPPAVEPDPSSLEARVAAIESDEILDDASSSALLTLVANLTARVTTLEGA